MKTKALKIVLFVMIGLLLFASCGSKKYAGFEVKDDYIMLPNPADVGFFSCPLELYKLAESNLKKVVDTFNSFIAVSESAIEKYGDISYAFYNLDIYDIEDYADYTQESLEKITSDSKLVNSIIESLKKAPEEDLESMDNFVCVASDIMDEFLYALEELYDYNNDDSWYDSKQEIFEEYVSEFQDDGVLEAMEFFFPNISVVTDFSKTEAAK